MSKKNWRIEYMIDGLLTVDYEEDLREAQLRCVVLMLEGYEPVLYDANQQPVNYDIEIPS